MEIGDVIKTKESSVSMYTVVNGSLNYAVTKTIETNDLKSIVCSVNKIESEGAQPVYQGICTLNVNPDKTKNLVYSLVEDCQDKGTIISDFDVILSAVK